MRNLLSSSIFFIIILCSCSVVHYNRFHISKDDGFEKRIDPVIQNGASALLYKAGIRIYGKYVSGLFLFKKMNDTTQRVVFSSETGITFFDFEFSGKDFNIRQCFEKFRNKTLISTFRKDLKMILMTGFHLAGAESVKYKKEEQMIYRLREGKEYFYFYLEEHTCSCLKIENTSRCFKKVIILLKKNASGVNSQISIRHKKIPLDIDLQLIPRI